MSTLVIILAQGEQRRLPNLTIAKQMLPLARCGGVPILHRTLRQLDHFGLGETSLVEVVTWIPVAQELLGVPDLFSRSYRFRVDTLEHPGNSSLKGLAAYLDKNWNARSATPSIGVSPFVATWIMSSAPVGSASITFTYRRVVVLFGDTVYSWAGLRACLGPSASAGSDLPFWFAGTSTLSTSTGELWGFGWDERGAGEMANCQIGALAKHSVHDGYQPGQMRRVLWEARARNQKLPPEHYVSIDDYTRDIDLPEHVNDLPRLSQLAAADDKEHGLTW